MLRAFQSKVTGADTDDVGHAGVTFREKLEIISSGIS